MRSQHLWFIQGRAGEQGALTLYILIKNTTIKYSLKVHFWTFKHYCSGIGAQRLVSWLQVTCAYLSFRIQSLLLPLVSIYRVRIRGSESWKGPSQLSSLNPVWTQFWRGGNWDPECFVQSHRSSGQGCCALKTRRKDMAGWEGTPRRLPRQGIHETETSRRTAGAVTLQVPVNWEAWLSVIPVIFHPLLQPTLVNSAELDEVLCFCSWNWHLDRC